MSSVDEKALSQLLAVHGHPLLMHTADGRWLCCKNGRWADSPTLEGALDALAAKNMRKP